MSWVPCDTMFIIAIRTVRYRNTFQFAAMARPSPSQLSCRVCCHTSDSRTRARTNRASKAGRPPMKKSGRQPQWGYTKK